MTSIARETLGFRFNGFSPLFSLLIPTFSLLNNPQLLTVLLRLVENAPLPLFRARCFGFVLQPRLFSAQHLSTGELLRTLLMMAASEPTSRLFSRHYLLAHLAQLLGPWQAVWTVFLSTTGLITRRLTPQHNSSHSQFD